MLPRLQAEERLNAIDNGHLVMGGFEKDDAAELMRAIEGRARGDRPAPPTKKRASPAELGAMGIGMRTVEPRPRDA